MTVRLNRFLVISGAAPSRRKADQLIQSGRITKNGVVVSELGTTVEVGRDQIYKGKKKLIASSESDTYVLFKPKGYVCSKRWGAGEKTVYDLIPRSKRLAIAGRLDKQSRGLLVMSSNGELVNILSHPSHGHIKVYKVKLREALSEKGFEYLKRGVSLDEGRAKFEFIKRIDKKTFEVHLAQGWKRQIRRMFDSVDAKVDDLLRTHIGNVGLGQLQEGKYEKIDDNDIIDGLE